MVGTAKTKYYTVDYRRRARQKKFGSIEQLAGAIDDIRDRLEKHVNSKHRDTAVRALMCMFIDHTCARIGNMTSAKAKKQTFGVTTLLTKKHAKILKDKIKISYTGKHEQPQLHTFRLFKNEADKKANPTEAIIAEKLKALVEEQNEYLFTNADGKPFAPQQVNEYFRADEPQPESNLPEGGANSPCTVHCFRNFHATRLFDEFAQQYIETADQPPYKEVLAAYNGRKETKSAPAVEGILQKIANHLGNTPAICRKAYIAPASQLLFFTRFGYRPPDGLLKDVFHDEIDDPYGLEKQKQFKFAKQRAKTARKRTKVTAIAK
jgi:DNA topoisomerase I